MRLDVGLLRGPTTKEGGNNLRRRLRLQPLHFLTRKIPLRQLHCIGVFANALDINSHLPTARNGEGGHAVSVGQVKTQILYSKERRVDRKFRLPFRSHAELHFTSFNSQIAAKRPSE